MRARSQRGFTLVEILVALGLAGLIVAGALQLNASFQTQSIRQDALNDLQQGLRMSMQILERAVRSAGAGMVAQKITIGATSYYGVQYRNVNTFPWPAAYDTNASDTDADADQLRVITNEFNGTYAEAKGDPTTAGNVRGALTGWAVHDLMLLVGGTSATSCLREVTGVTSSPATSLALAHSNAGTNYAGVNPAADTCITALTWPTPVRRFVHETIYKVFDASGTDPPKLAMRWATIGDNTNTPAWSLISENIEDMQIALLMADGTVCNKVDDPALCDPSTVRAVRITLVARTSQKMASAPAGRTGGYEDRPDTAVTDQYLRRALTSEILLRN